MRLVAGLISILALAACNFAADAQGDEVAANGAGTQRSFTVGEFDTVSLGGYHNVVVNVGPAGSARAEGPAEELDRLELRMDGSTLRIGTKRNLGSWKSKGPVTVYVTTPRLAGASIGGSGDMRIDRVEGPRFSGSIGGSGDMNIAQLGVEDANFSIAGSGGITAAGTAASTDVSIAGSGDMRLAGLESRNASISIVGSGDVAARAMERANVSIMGSGDVVMSGPAECDVSKMGSGSVRCTG